MEENHISNYLQEGGSPQVQEMRQFQHQCRICGLAEGLRRCSRCQVAYYCCQEHQRLDWRVHKLECRSIHQLQSSSATTMAVGSVLQSTTAAQQQQQYQSSQGFYQTSSPLVVAGPQQQQMMATSSGAVFVGSVGDSAFASAGNATMANGVRAEILSTNGVQLLTNTSTSPLNTQSPLLQQQQLRQQQSSPPLLPPPQHGSTSSSPSSPSSGSSSSFVVVPPPTSFADSVVVSAVAAAGEADSVSKLFASDSLASVEELLDLDNIDVDHILNENNFLNNINNLNFLDESLAESCNSVDNQSLVANTSSCSTGSGGSNHSSSNSNSNNSGGLCNSSVGSGSGSEVGTTSPHENYLQEDQGEEVATMQLTQPAIASSLQQQQQQLFLASGMGSGSASPVMLANSSTTGSSTPTSGGNMSSTDESVSALLNAKIDNLLHQSQMASSGMASSRGLANNSSNNSITSQEDALLAELEQESLDEACRNLIRDMNEYGVCVLDNFLGQDRGVKVLQEVTGMYSSGVFKDGQLVSNRGGKNMRHIRGDKITWIGGREPGCANIGYLINRVDAVITNCRRMKNNGKLGHYNIRERTKAMVACYPGSGSHYVKHVDNPNRDGRCITAIYYLNLNWDVQQSGGLLRIFPEGCNDRVADIEPIFDRILFFWSDRRNPHEVQPSHRTRYAITLWYLDAEERESARLRYQRDCENRYVNA